MIFLFKLGEANTKYKDEVNHLGNGRGIMMAGLAGLAVGIYVGNTMKKGMVPRQLRSTGKTIIRRARGTVGRQLNDWLE